MTEKCWCGGRVVAPAWGEDGSVRCFDSPLHDPRATGRKTKIKKIYIAGPMSGYAQCNYPAFNKAAEDLRMQGYEVVNPVNVHVPDRHHYVDLLREDLRSMLDCDGVAVLEKWWESTGARNEVNVAGLLKMPVQTVDEWIRRGALMGALLVLEKWEMDVFDTLGDQPWFADWVSRKINESSAHISAGAAVLDRVSDLVDPPARIVEAFGGLGCQTLVAQDLWPGVPSVVYENSSDAVDHLNSLRETGLTNSNVIRGDAYLELDPQPGDGVLLDFGDMTASRMTSGGKYTLLLERVFAAQPRFVVLTDIAGRLYHLHKDHYSEALETEISDYQSYLRAVGGYVRDHWGYYPAVTSYQRWSAVMGFLPAPCGHLIGPVIDEPRGLQKI